MLLSHSEKKALILVKLIKRLRFLGIYFVFLFLFLSLLSLPLFACGILHASRISFFSTKSIVFFIFIRFELYRIKKRTEFICYCIHNIYFLSQHGTFSTNMSCYWIFQGYQERYNFMFRKWFSLKISNSCS